MVPPVMRIKYAPLLHEARFYNRHVYGTPLQDSCHREDSKTRTKKLIEIFNLL